MLQWFVDICELLCSGPSSTIVSCPLEWLGYLAAAANKVRLSTTSSGSAEHQLLAYGRRRAKEFLGVSTKQWPPFFGLGKDSIQAGLVEELDEERAIAYLRKFVMENSYRSSDAYIGSKRGHRWLANADVTVRAREYMTAVPHTCASRKRDADGNQVMEITHARWIYIEASQQLQVSEVSEQFVDRMLEDRFQYITARGERAMRIHDALDKLRAKDWVWKHAPRLFKSQKRSLSDNNNSADVDLHRCPSTSLADGLCRCFDYDNHITEQIVFSQSWSIGDYTVFVKEDAEYTSPRILEDGIELRGESYLHPTVSARRLCKSSMKADTVLQNLHHMMNPVTTQPRGP